ncbi:cytochrome p450 [Hirsutella rhossiliensis]|uniref:Cytochrome p450 domain-containing protein n=1 Tax=Hirsutella rhossiliensis TaxID=111463 RepID=A0A9P8N8T3_9HYPO|nr:cytochrome p450 domain-containing protein [Hirsutella rhossiliensis]KAH0968829.1 cytochrome p450 domain-containing protein [Hirsutella rhossiliensis]
MTALHLTSADIPDLRGKVVVLTGGASGIGLAAARIFASKGATVHVLDRVPIDYQFDIFEVPGYELGSQPNELGPFSEVSVIFHKCNVVDWKELRSVFEKVGGVDIVVANAGISEEADFFSDVYDSEGNLQEPAYEVIDVNLKAVLNVTKLALNKFAKQKPGGSIVITASATAYSPEQSLPVYSASKAALVGLIRALRPSMKKFGATINGVAPAATISKLLPKNLAAPIIQAGSPVSKRQVEAYGKDDPNEVRSLGRWNGRVILTLGDCWTELEEPIAALRLQWFGEYNTEKTAFQQVLTDMSHWVRIRRLNSWVLLLEPEETTIIDFHIQLVLYGLATILYNLYFHPLAAFPGPWLGRSSLLWRFIHTSTGRVHVAIEQQHRKFGPIVRVSPNELSFGSVESWKAIYGFKKLCIGSERDPSKHGNMRKMLSAAFSQKSLLDQEKIVSDKIDQFVEIIGVKGSAESDGINLTKWYEMVSFDILGEMAFGESFYSLEAGKPHFWSDLVEEHLYFITLLDNLSRIGALAKAARFLIPSNLLVRNKNSQYSRAKVERILAMKTTRKDFISLLAQKVRCGEVDKEEMTAHVSTLAIAGGETVSTFLAATTSFLLKNPATLKRVTDEIRGSFQSYEDITAQAAQTLRYLQSVINEGLRLYPPGSQGFPRISPGFQIHGQHIPQGAEIYTSAWTVTHDPKHFLEPMEFKPERWMDKNSSDVKEASQPFSLGPRGCLGRNFAYMEVNLLLAKMLWTYDLDLVNDKVDFIKDGQVFVMWWKPELRVRFRRRSSISNDREM